MNVVLVNPPIETQSRLWYPIGIAYVATFLRQRGFEIEVIDLIGEDITRNAFIDRIEAVQADYFGIGGIVTAFNNVIDIAGYIRAAHPNAFIFAGNTVAYTVPEILLKHSAVDAIVLGEGEITTSELIAAHSAGEDLRGVDGIMFKDASGSLVTTAPREALKDLDSLPHPSWDLLPIEEYFVNAGHRYCIVSTVRGCPFNCTFCCKTFMNYKTRFRSAESIIDELTEFHRRYDISSFYFFDDLSMVMKPNLIKFCELKMESPLAVMPWTISGRLSLFDEEIARALRSAGVTDVAFGIESLDQDVLDMYNKKLRVDQVHAGISLCEKYDLPYSGSSFLIGAINETRESVKKSADFCRQHDLRYEPHFVTPFPGTQLYEYALEEGLVEDEFEYLKKISAQGNTDYLLVNLTRNFSDDELISLRDENLFFPESHAVNQTVEKPGLAKLMGKGIEVLRSDPGLFIRKVGGRVRARLARRENDSEDSIDSGRYGNSWR